MVSYHDSKLNYICKTLFPNKVTFAESGTWTYLFGATV